MVADAQGVTVDVLTAVELRDETGRLLGVLVPGQRLEIARGGVVSVFDVQTGRLTERRVMVRERVERWTRRR